MLKYIGKRLLAMIPVLIGVSFLIFMILKLAPGDPVYMILGNDAPAEAYEALREEMHLNDPAIVQYGYYMSDLLRGDLGESYVNHRPVADEIKTRIPATFKLAGTSALLSIALAIPLGIIAAVYSNSIFDRLSMILSLVGISMPAFWLALMLMLLFSVKLGWLPAQGANAGWKSYVMPSMAIGFMNMAAIARTTRSSMLDTIRSDYVRTARSKGINEWKVIMHHSFRNALIPVLTIVGSQFGGLLGGATLTETVFAWPGLGRMMVTAVNGRDVPTVEATILLLSFAHSIVNLIVDLLYAVVDPRVKTMFK